MVKKKDLIILRFLFFHFYFLSMDILAKILSYTYDIFNGVKNIHMQRRLSQILH